MADIFKEVDEDVRRDQAMALWQRYRWLIVGAVVLIVGGTAGYNIWREYDAGQRLDSGERFEAASDLARSGNYDAAASAFAKFAEDTGSTYGVLARLREAAARAQAGDGKGAIAVYDTISASGDGDAALRDLAGLLAARALLDDGLIAEAEKRLQPLAATVGPWQHMAREMQGVAAVQAGRKDEARALFAALGEEAGVPDGVKRRAGEMLAALGPQ
ncbi:MAG: tetratricopeptide repeat protein [Alphaproteobacteria bacterium]|nr:tetratricopeptide repeat protein [Alphaproteobacteria bacterium]